MKKDIFGLIHHHRPKFGEMGLAVVKELLSRDNAVLFGGARWNGNEVLGGKERSSCLVDLIVEECGVS